MLQAQWIEHTCMRWQSMPGQDQGIVPGTALLKMLQELQ